MTDNSLRLTSSPDTDAYGTVLYNTDTALDNHTLQRQAASFKMETLGFRYASAIVCVALDGTKQ